MRRMSKKFLPHFVGKNVHCTTDQLGLLFPGYKKKKRGLPEISGAE